MIDCNDCPHLIVTEAQQEHLWKISKKKVMFPHICSKYNRRVLHYPYREPMICPCRQCEEDMHKEIYNETFGDHYDFGY